MLQTHFKIQILILMFTSEIKGNVRSVSLQANEGFFPFSTSQQEDFFSSEKIAHFFRDLTSFRMKHDSINFAKKNFFFHPEIPNCQNINDVIIQWKSNRISICLLINIWLCFWSNVSSDETHISNAKRFRDLEFCHSNRRKTFFPQSKTIDLNLFEKKKHILKFLLYRRLVLTSNFFGQHRKDMKQISNRSKDEYFLKWNRFFSMKIKKSPTNSGGTVKWCG